MRLPPWLLSFVFPLCATIGSSAMLARGRVEFQKLVRAVPDSALITARWQVFLPGPSADRAALNARSIHDYGDVRVTLTPIKPIATAL